MPGGNLKKNLPYMTRGEIAAALVAGTVIGGAILAWAVRILWGVDEWTARLAAWAMLWPGTGMLLVVGCLLSAYVQAFRELRRRRIGNSVAAKSEGAGPFSGI